MDSAEGETKTRPEREAKTRPERRPRAWWQWVLGVGLLATATVLLVVRIVGPRVRPDLLLKEVEPRTVRVSPELEVKSTLPAEPGDFAGCNLLLVTFDTTRADRLGCYGHDDIETPTLDQLAREGVLFSQAIAPGPTTLPSHASILTGLYPYHHQARANGVFVLPDAARTLAEVLAEQGYTTAAVVSAFVLDSQFGLDQGFAEYDDDLSQGQRHGWLGELERRADQTTDRALAWLEKHGDERFFVWVHYFDPHAEYQPPSPYAERYKDVPYDGEIAFADAQFGRLLGALADRGLTDKTLAVVTSDHGESLGQHGEWAHGYLLYESTLRVPLIMRCGQRLGGGVHVAGQVCLVDIMPTVLSLLGIEAPVVSDGVDLTRAGDPGRPVFVETLEGLNQWGLAPLHAVRAGKLKYILGPDPELYDLGSDPRESNNLLAAQAQTAADLRRLMSEFYDNNLEQAAYHPATAQLSQWDQIKLGAIGYIDGGFGDAPPPQPLPDPKAKMKVIERLQFALKEEKIPDRIAQLESLARRDPDFMMVHRYLGDSYVAMGDLAKAREAYERCLEIFPDAPYVLLALAQLATFEGDLTRAEELCLRALSRNPERLNVLRQLGDLLAAQQKYDAAADEFIKCFSLRPSDDEIVQKMVLTLSHVGRREQALDLLRNKLAAQPRVVAARIALASLLAEGGEHLEAVGMLREGLALQPGQLDMMMALAVTLVTGPNPDHLRPIEAAVLAEEVCQKTQYRYPGYLRGLALVYLAQRRTDEAIGILEKALAICQETGQTALLPAINQTLAECRAAKEAGITPLSSVPPLASQPAEEAQTGSNAAPADAE